MRKYLPLVLAFLLTGAQAASALAQNIGPDGTPQLDSASETMRYSEAATSQLLTHYWIVMSELDQFPANPTPDQTKASQLRKRVLDLRLVMDLNAFTFQPGTYEAYRDAADAVYEQVGQYKDLFDVQPFDRTPFDASYSAERLAKMNISLAPFRLPSFREDLKNFFYQLQPRPLALEQKNQPRLWQIAQTGPDTGLDSVGNTAMLGQRVLRNLQGMGLTVGDIVDPVQEAHFHDIRKALRSVLVLSDMFPTLANQTSSVRQPLADVVKAYGDVNDRFTAYHLAQISGHETGSIIDDLRANYNKALDVANRFSSTGQLDAYASQLEQVQNSHRR
jgi:hypothetical protein